MVIELLRATCPKEKQAAFIQRDSEVWTPALASHAGFLGKEVWVSSDSPNELAFIIRWESMEQWKTFPAELAIKLDGQMGDLLMPLTCETYEVSLPNSLG